MLFDEVVKCKYRFDRCRKVGRYSEIKYEIVLEGPKEVNDR